MQQPPLRRPNVSLTWVCDVFTALPLPLATANWASERSLHCFKLSFICFIVLPRSISQHLRTHKFNIVSLANARQQVVYQGLGWVTRHGHFPIQLTVDQWNAAPFYTKTIGSLRAKFSYGHRIDQRCIRDDSFRPGLQIRWIKPQARQWLLLSRFPGQTHVDQHHRPVLIHVECSSL